jgi:hypothetical protein
MKRKNTPSKFGATMLESWTMKRVTLNGRVNKMKLTTDQMALLLCAIEEKIEWYKTREKEAKRLNLDDDFWASRIRELTAVYTHIRGMK